MGRFSKEELVAQATEIFGNEKDAFAIVNEFIPDGDKFGDVNNLLKRFKCWQSLQEIGAFIENPNDSKLEKIHEAKEAMYKQLLELTKRTDNLQNQKEVNDDSDEILMKIIAKENKNKKVINDDNNDEITIDKENI